MGIEDPDCGLVYPDLVKLTVSVWNAKERKFINNLNATDLEIHEGGRIYKLDYFVKPNNFEVSELPKNSYVIGFIPDDFMRKTWRHLEVKVKNLRGSRNLIVKVSPNGYFY